jgi:hypothetical protein
MKKMGRKNHPDRSYFSGMSGFNGFPNLRKDKNHGICAIVAGSINCFNNSGVTPFVLISSFKRFLDSSVKLYNLKVHSEIKIARSFAKVFTFRQNGARVFVIEKYAEVPKWEVGTFGMFSVIGLSVLPAHYKSKLLKLRCKIRQAHPAE